VPAPILVTAFVFVVLCVIWDVRVRRIPNLLSGGAMLAGVVLNVVCLGVQGVLSSAAGFLVTVGLLWAPFYLGGIGGGDVKMMAALGTLLGPALAFQALLIGMIVGGAITLVHLARIGRLKEKVASTGNIVRSAVSRGSLQPLKNAASDPSAVWLPYSVPLGIGAIAVMVVSGLHAG